MKLSTSLVAVKRIQSTVPRSKFSDQELEQAAKAILEAEGIINPIVLRRNNSVSPDISYEIVNGDFEYYAAARAREIDPRKGEMISAYIFEDEKEEALRQQIKLLREAKSKHYSSNQSGIRSENLESLVTDTTSRMTKLETRLEDRLSELQAEYKKELNTLKNRLEEVESKLPKPIEPLEALNTWTLQKLAPSLKRANVKTSVIETIIKEREKNGHFRSLSDAISRVKGLAEKTMIKIVDSFSEGFS